MKKRDFVLKKRKKYLKITSSAVWLFLQVLRNSDEVWYIREFCSRKNVTENGSSNNVNITLHLEQKNYIK